MKRLSPEDGRIYVFQPEMRPVLSVRSGETIEFVCEDSCGGQIRSEADTLGKLDFNRVNGATGPVRVEGARPGDALRLDVLDLHVESPGFQAIGPGYGVLGASVSSPRTKIIPLRGRGALFSAQIRLPIRPHVGTVGVAPRDKGWTTFYPGDHGGNLDTKEVSQGNTLYLPVFQPGAQLAMGDLHALMGDGEVCVTGIEVAGTVKVRLRLIRGLRLQRPLVETRDAWMALASAPTLDEAATLATKDGVEFLARGTGLPWEEAYMLASIACDLRVSQFVDPWKTAKFVVPKRLVPKLSGIEGGG